MILSLGKSAVWNNQYLEDREILVFATGNPTVSVGAFYSIISIQHSSGVTAPQTEVVVGKFADDISIKLPDTSRFLSYELRGKIPTFTSVITAYALVAYSIILEPFSKNIADTSGLVLSPPITTKGESVISTVMDGGGYGIYIKRDQEPIGDGLDKISITSFE